MYNRMAKSKQRVIEPIHIPPPQIINFFIGDKYYRRIQPIPYQYKIDLKKAIKNLLA
jgi:hypothetical protein